MDDRPLAIRSGAQGAGQILGLSSTVSGLRCRQIIAESGEKVNIYDIFLVY